MFKNFLNNISRLCIIQAENPDGDSLGSALALDYLLPALNPNLDISLFCPVDIPKYLRYFPDWSRVSSDFTFNADAYIIVDTAASTLLSKLLSDPVIANTLEKKPILVLDHHETPDDLPFPHISEIQPLPSCCNLIFRLAKKENLPVSPAAAENLIYGILSDTLGLTAAATTPDTYRDVADLLELGDLNIAVLEERRRDFMKKSQRIFSYKADLIKRTDFLLNGSLATIHIPWEDIQTYSDEYNPSVLIIEELRLVEGVETSVAIKTYPDGKLTGKIRSTLPIADKIAGYFGGGGHPYAAGFRTYDTSYEEVQKDLVSLLPSLKENIS